VKIWVATHRHLDKRWCTTKAVPVPAVELEKVSKVFRPSGGGEVLAVDELSLEVARGELLTVVGPSGSGKSTTLRLVAGLEEPCAGKVRLGGRSMQGVPPHGRDVALVLQEHPLFPHLSVARNLAFGPRLRGVPAPEIARRVREATSLLGLEPLLSRAPATLSGGERQRVALGAALARGASVLLLDEPLAQLDEPLRLELRGELKRLHRRLQWTALFVSHDQAEALALGDRIAVLHHGRLQQIGPPEALYRRPANLTVARFLGSPPMGLLRGRLERGERGPLFSMKDGPGFPVPLTTLQRAREDLFGRPLLVGIRPEDLRIGNGAPAGAAALAATVEGVERTGPDAWVRLRVSGTMLMSRGGREGVPEEGSATTVWFGAEDAHWFDEGTQGRVWELDAAGASG
jgi:multiple sugar transport system ATP-binding protein